MFITPHPPPPSPRKIWWGQPNVALQAQRDVYQAQLKEGQDTITHLKTRYVDHARGPGKNNITIIVQKHTAPVKDKYHDLPYYVARIQRRKRYALS